MAGFKLVVFTSELTCPYMTLVGNLDNYQGLKISSPLHNNNASAPQYLFGVSGLYHVYDLRYRIINERCHFMHTCTRWIILLA